MHDYFVTLALAKPVCFAYQTQRSQQPVSLLGPRGRDSCDDPWTSRYTLSQICKGKSIFLTRAVCLLHISFLNTSLLARQTCQCTPSSLTRGLQLKRETGSSHETKGTFFLQHEGVRYTLWLAIPEGKVSWLCVSSH